MTVSQHITVQFPTVDFRAAMAAVYAHRSRSKDSDKEPLYRVRLTFARQNLFVSATNTVTTGLARVPYLSDSRDTALGSGQWDPDDQPFSVDLTPRRAHDLQSLFPTSKDAEMNQLVAIDVDHEDNVLDFTDIGGLLSAGESHRYPFEDPDPQMPDVLAITASALAAAQGATARGSELVQDGRVMGLFEAASRAYMAPMRLQKTGSADSRGWLAEIGRYFVGTVSSDHGGDDMGKRQSYHDEWVRILPAAQLKSA
jgi:hypothetical protein